LGFERSDLAQAADMPLSPAEPCCQERVDEVPGYPESHDPAAHADDVHIVVFNTLSCREVIVNQSRPNARNLVCTYRGADAAAADCHAAIYLPGNNRAGKWNDKVGIIVARIHAVRPDVDYLVPGFAEVSEQLFLEFESAVIGSNSDTHVIFPSSV
jgi:hypothetical protein